MCVCVCVCVWEREMLFTMIVKKERLLNIDDGVYLALI